MSSLYFVKEALKPFCSLTESGGAVVVPTHCLYPSGTIVTVYVVGGEREAVVSDEGGAIDQLTTHNHLIPKRERDRLLKRFCRESGLRSTHGRIYSPPVTGEQLVAAVLRVANASAAAAKWGHEHYKLKQKRNLHEELHSLISNSFDEDRVESGAKLSGKSTRTYTFSEVIRINQNHFLVVDPVVPDANSINSRVVAHLDLKQLEDDRFVQRVVYDEEDDWSSADLSLMQMASTLVPFSKVQATLSRFKVGQF